MSRKVTLDQTDRLVPPSTLLKERGVWVLRTREVVAAEETANALRDSRDFLRLSPTIAGRVRNPE